MANSKIDVHHHILPLTVVRLLEMNPGLTSGLKLPAWSHSLSLEFMERNEIDTAIYSLPIPATLLCEDDRKAVQLCRQVNEEMAGLRSENPGRTGFFAAVPSPRDAEACVLEIRYALDNLAADGVVLFTSYDGKYLGHPDFQLVWRELAARAAVVFIHPTIEGADRAVQEPFPLPRPLFDWPHETTRTAMHLVMTRTLRENAGCKVILSHGGGTLPYVAGRAADLSHQMRLLDMPPGDFLDECRAFYFDIALAGYGGPLELLLEFAQPGHVLYGTDFPFAREQTVVSQAASAQKVFGGRDVAAQVERRAAEALFPHLRRRQTGDKEEAVAL